MILIRIIDVIGYSGSGKTSFIVNAIKLLKNNFNYNVTVIKNVKHHSVDEKGKDSYNFTKAGASYSVIQNIKNETAIFVNSKGLKNNALIKWINKGPYKIDVLFTEGFRNLNNPTVLCISNLSEIEEQLTKNVKIISGIICVGNLKENEIFNLPIIDIENEFSKFIKIFNLN